MRSNIRNFFVLAAVFVLLGLFALAAPARAAAYTASISGNWSNPATWGGSGPPTAADTVTINSGVIVTVDTAAECASITINAPAANNGITISGTNNLTVSGAITMNSPTAGIITSTIAVGTGTLNAGSISIPGSATASRFCTVSVSTGTINVTGAITFSGTAAQARLMFTDAGTLNIGGNLGAGGTFTASTGTVNCNGSLAQTLGGGATSYTYNVLKTNNTAGVTLGRAATITTLTIGDITSSSIFNDGGFVITPGAGSVLNISNAGTYNLGSATVGTAWPAWGTRNIAAGTTVGYISGVAQTVSATPTYQNLTLSGAGTKTITAMTAQGNFTSSGGIINMTAIRIISLGGNYNSSSDLSNNNRLTLNLNGSGAQTVTNTITPLTLSTFTVNKAGGTATLGVNITTVVNLTVTAGTLDLSTYTADRTAAGGTMTIAAGATVKIGGTNTLPANYTTYTFGTPSTIEYYGGDQMIGPRTHRNLILSGSGTKTLQAGTTTISNNLTLSGTVSTTTVVGLTIGGVLNVGDGTTFTAAGFALTVTGNTIVGGGTSGNLIISAAAGAKTFIGPVTINTNGTWNNSGNSAIVFRGGITNNGTFTAGTGVHTFNTNAQDLNGTLSIPSVTVTGVTLTNNGTLTVTTALAGTGGLTNAATGTLNIGFTGPPGITTLTASASGNTVNYNRAGAQTVRATTYSNLTLSGSGAKTFPAGTTTVNSVLSMEGTATTTLTGTLTYGAGATLQYQGSAAQTTGAEFPATFGGSGVIINNSNGVNLGSSRAITNNLTLTSGTFTVGANTLTLNGLTISGTPANLSTTASSSLVFGGSSMGVNIPSSVTVLNNLTINNANGVTLNSSPTINGTLTLTSGKITTGSNSVIISASGSVAGGSSGSYVTGNLQKNVATGAATRTFEVGATNYNPVTVAFGNVSTAGYLTVKATTGQHPNVGSSTLHSNKYVNVYWSLTNSGIVFNNYNATFTFVAGDILGGANTASFIIGKYNSGWTYPTVGVKTSTTTQATGITSFSDFVLGEATPLAPTVNTDSATLVEETTATLDGTLTNDGGEDCEYRFEWDTNTGEPYSFNTPWTGNYSSGQSFNVSLTGLDKGTKYYFRVQARNGGGTISGTELTLLTKPDAPVTASSSTISGTKISLTWIKGEGAQRTVVVRKIGGYPADRTDGTVIYFNTGTSVVDSDLSLSTTYYYRLWSQVSGSEQWSDGYVDASSTTGSSFFSSSSKSVLGGETSPINKATVLAPLLIIPLLIACISAAVLFRLKKRIICFLDNIKGAKRYLALFFILSLLMTSMLIPSSQPAANISTEPRAAIIDQTSVFEPDSGFVSKVAAMLESAGFKVDVWQGQAVTVDFYRELPRYGYELIVFRTHMSFYYPGTDSSLIKGTALFSGETYSTTKHITDQLNDTVFKASVTSGSATVFAINSKFITDTMEGRFDGTAILMMGCISYYLDDMAEAFLQKGASTYVGWDGKVILDHLDQATVDFIDNLFIKQLCIETAAMQTMATIGPDPYCNARLKYYHR